MSEQESHKPSPLEINSLDGEIVLEQYSVENAQAIFDAIDSSRSHLSQFGDETAIKYPTVNSVIDSITKPSNPERLRMAIKNKEGRVVGGINLTPQDDPKIGEIGYWLAESATGKGYMVRAVEALTQYGFDELGYRSIFGDVVEGNNASISVLNRAGYGEEERKDGHIILYKYKGE